MKKKIFGGTVILSIALITVLNVNMKMNKNNLSAFSLANIEALADPENPPKDSKTRKDTQQDKKTTVCDGKTHTTTKEPGYTRSCSGTGYVECEPGWYSTGGQKTTSTASHSFLTCPN